MTYSVKSIFHTLQGEGANTGRAAVFCRFAGCNLWSGREEDRAKAICDFCDTDFVGGDRFGQVELADAIVSRWLGDIGRRFVIFTGGEPLLQLDAALVDELHGRGFEVAIETNGTRLPPPGVNWICVSPKARADCVLRAGHELKLIFPQMGAEPEQFERWDFRHFFLQPMDGPQRENNTLLAIRYCLEHPQWRLSLQTQKMLGIP